MRTIIIILSALISFQSMAQEIAGMVIDEKREPMISAVIQVYTGGILKGGTVTDYDGNYVIKPLDPGYYDVLAIFNGYDSSFTNKVLVSPNQRTFVSFNLSKINGQPKIITKEYRKPLVVVDGPHSPIPNDEIRQLPGCGPTDLCPTSVGVYQTKRGEDVSFRGSSRNCGTVYIIDSVLVENTIGTEFYASLIPKTKESNFNPNHYVFSSDEIRRSPYCNVNDIISLIPGAYQQRRGDEVRFYGGR